MDYGARQGTDQHKLTTNQRSLYRSRDWLSANQGLVFLDSVANQGLVFLDSVEFQFQRQSIRRVKNLWGDWILNSDFGHFEKNAIFSQRALASFSPQVLGSSQRSPLGHTTGRFVGGLGRGGTSFRDTNTTNQNSLFMSRDWLSANKGPVFFLILSVHDTRTPCIVGIGCISPFLFARPLKLPVMSITNRLSHLARTIITVGHEANMENLPALLIVLLYGLNQPAKQEGDEGCRNRSIQVNNQSEHFIYVT
eukprot:sb/3468731/